MRRKASFKFTSEQRQAVETLLNKSTTEQRIAERASIILDLMNGKSGYRIAQERGCQVRTVYTWRNRFLTKGIDGLSDRPRSGQPRKITEDIVRKVLDLTMHALPRERTRWTRRTMSKYAGCTEYQVQRIWSEANLRPHMTSTFNFSKDPEFAEKVIDVVGLYMNTPENAVVLSIDEKTQIQALDHTQPLLQLRPGQVERHTHDYVRHGTTSLYAAYDIVSGRVIGRCSQRHRAKEFLSFMNLVDRRLSGRRNCEEVHVILDNSSTHKTREVQEWRNAHPKFRFHFTPTSSSWLNAVENWFSRVERFGLQGKAFKSVQQLREHLRKFIVTFNRTDAKPFVWTKDPATILASVDRARKAAASQGERKIIGAD